jgi:hypothetical protein
MSRGFRALASWWARISTELFLGEGGGGRGKGGLSDETDLYQKPFCPGLCPFLLEAANATV